MKRVFKALTAISTVLTLNACSAHTQLTSGNDYLSRYTPSQARLSSTIDQDVREIATIEPNLQFPARIGLARIERGQLTNAPVDELASWSKLSDELGPAYGEFVPVSPFIASMVRPEDTKLRTEHVVSDIRRASARQHLDYVLVYEVSNKTENDSNALSLGDLTILGLYVLPSRNIKVESTASALLLDVRNGYPYGTATAFAEAKKVATRAGSGSYRQKLNDTTKLDAVINLTDEVEVMFEELYRELTD
ncbi:MAG: hypothetical protein HKO02_07720 [Hyphomonadaceae bacterium]|nr:hypothetical protein [Hyphomonadaceae bacterium]